MRRLSSKTMKLDLDTEGRAGSSASAAPRRPSHGARIVELMQIAEAGAAERLQRDMSCETPTISNVRAVLSSNSHDSIRCVCTAGEIRSWTLKRQARGRGGCMLLSTTLFLEMDLLITASMKKLSKPFSFGLRRSTSSKGTPPARISLRKNSMSALSSNPSSGSTGLP